MLIGVPVSQGTSRDAKLPKGNPRNPKTQNPCAKITQGIPKLTTDLRMSALGALMFCDFKQVSAYVGTALNPKP